MRSRAPAARHRLSAARTGALLLLLPIAGAGGCDTLLGGATTIEGTWLTEDDGQTIYVRVTDSAVTLFRSVTGACYFVDAFDRIDREGDTHTLQRQASASASTIDVILRIEDDRLRVHVLDGASALNLLFDATDDDPGGFDECTVFSTWVRQFESGGQPLYEYLDITSGTLRLYLGVPDECVVGIAFDIVGQDGNTFTLSNPAGEVFDIILVVEDGRLSVASADAPGDVTVYDPTTDDPSTYEACEPVPTPGDPSIDCSTLPPISVGEAIDGELTTDDPNYGWYYDLYGLTLAATQEITISMTSSDFNTYIQLWEADGTFIEADDDGGDGTDSSLTITLDAACYRIEASSFATDVTGAYALSVN